MFHVKQLEMFENKNCPVCTHSSFSRFIICEDFTVSHERFIIVSCDACGFKFTNPRPSETVLGNYYKAEEYISHTNTRRGIVARLYHLVREHTLRQKVKLLESYATKGSVLDFGCGTGMFLNACKRAGWQVVGIEPDSGARTIAGQMISGIYDSKSSLEASGFSTFDVITLWHVLEHVSDLTETIAFLHHKLKDGGVLIIAVPNHLSYDALVYKEHWAAYDVPRHLYHFSLQTLNALLEKNGFRMLKSLPMKFDSFYVSMLSEKYRSGSINYFRALITGLKSNFKAASTGNYSSKIYIFKKKQGA
jgi:2-polyprenyl-3-methyl-5-hydroxy-6-metoxy-1,4-benzoquinol methylase